jgi:hypothetical protein
MWQYTAWIRTGESLGCIVATMTVAAADALISTRLLLLLLLLAPA